LYGERSGGGVVRRCDDGCVRDDGRVCGDRRVCDDLRIDRLRELGLQKQPRAADVTRVPFDERIDVAISQLEISRGQASDTHLTLQSSRLPPTSNWLCSASKPWMISWPIVPPTAEPSRADHRMVERLLCGVAQPRHRDRTAMDMSLWVACGRA